MADKKLVKAAISGPPIDPEAFYKIKVRRVVEAANQKFRPQYDYVVKGKILADIGDKLASYEPAELMH